jgi:hypothetical protein
LRDEERRGSVESNDRAFHRSSVVSQAGQQPRKLFSGLRKLLYEAHASLSAHPLSTPGNCKSYPASRTGDTWGSRHSAAHARSLVVNRFTERVFANRAALRRVSVCNPMRDARAS